MKASLPLFCRRLILPALLSLFFFMLSPSPAVRAQGTCVSLATLGSAYSQDFNALANTAGSSTNALTIPGWYLHESGTSARNNGLYAVASGSDNTGDTYSFGADGSTERALGGLRVGALIPTFGACFTNNTGSTLTRLNVAYSGEEWRLGTAGRTDQINFEYSPSATSLTTGAWTGIPALDFTTPDAGIEGAKNGNAAGEHTTLSATIAGLSIANGTTFWIRWMDDNASGPDDGLAIDDFSLTPLTGTLLNVTHVSSTNLNGAYTIGDILSITVTFSQPVNVTGIPQLTLETGATDRVVNYSSGSGTAILTFDYTIQAGDTSSDLDYSSVNALIFNGGSIEDAAGNDATLTLPAPGAPGSLGANTAIVIDTITPDTTIDTHPPSPTNNNTASFTFSGTDNLTPSASLTFECRLDSGGWDSCPASYTGLADGSHTFWVRAIDQAGNVDSIPASFTWVIDTAVPSVTMTSAAPDSTNTSPISITVQFSEPVANFVAGDIRPSNGTVNGFAGTGATYSFALIPSGQGLVTADIAAGVAQDIADNGNSAAPQFSRTYDSVAPTAMIAPAAGQLDPTSGSPINFTATFSEAVTDFDGTDVTVSGTAGATMAVVTGDGTAYNVAISDMTGGGTVIVSIPADRTQDAAGNGNTASGNATVTFTPLGITSPNHVTFVAGNPASFPVTTVGAPPATISYTGTLPSGIGLIDNGNGTATLSGTPALSSIGAYNLTFTAHIAGITPDATQAFSLTIDGPPGVAQIHSFADTGDGQILENEHTSASITRLLVIFNKDMDTTDVETESNYHLALDGSPDIPINLASYGSAFTATLNINGGTELPDGRYTLTIEDDLRDTLAAPISTDFIRHFFVDHDHPHHIRIATLPANSTITNGATVNVPFTSIDIAFSEDLNNPAGDVDPDDATNPQNYMLVSTGPDSIFDTSSCALGRSGDDVQIPTGPVTYNNHAGAGPFVATVQLNDGTALANGLYRLYICGTTSLVDLALNSLNNNTDELVTFNVLTTSPATENPLRSVKRNPQTGFAPGVITLLPEQPAEKAYTNLGALWIEIPRLDLKTVITGVPLAENGWDVTWLNRQVGWLEGTAYPTWEGNTVLTAHGYTADGEAGPFALLKNLSYGENIIIHLGGMKYTYAVRTNLLINPSDTRWLTHHEKLDWITLVTCQQYDEKTQSYRYRRVVRAVLIRVEKE